MGLFHRATTAPRVTGLPAARPSLPGHPVPKARNACARQRPRAATASRAPARQRRRAHRSPQAARRPRVRRRAPERRDRQPQRRHRYPAWLPQRRRRRSWRRCSAAPASSILGRTPSRTARCLRSMWIPGLLESEYASMKHQHSIA